jgi:hypothetical protein
MTQVICRQLSLRLTIFLDGLQFGRHIYLSGAVCIAKLGVVHL